MSLELRSLLALHGARAEGSEAPHCTLRDRILGLVRGVTSSLSASAAAAAPLGEDELLARPDHVLLLFAVEADARLSAFALPAADLDADERAALDAACTFAGPGDVGDDPARWRRLMWLVAAADGHDDDELCEILVEQTEEAFGESTLSVEELARWAGRWQPFRITTPEDWNRRFVGVSVAVQVM